MGVPSFFRWLSQKYATIVVHCVEERSKEVNGVKVPVDSSKPNPNDTEFDNLYLDMNGIIHPCCHPEDKPAPKNEDEMMVLIFEYIDRIYNIVRPRKVLYMAIDGVAPRAKMNQQRSRRFRASKESIEKAESMATIREELLTKGCSLPPDKPHEERFDSNCITPGTPFMFRLADCLRYYIHDRLNNDPGWSNVKVILSDANVPGEGEHKIVDYIRRQRAMPDHDPQTHHCLCGADADLIMLGLATHEPHFTIIREEFKPNQPKPCDMCGQVGHEMAECAGLPKEKSGEHDEIQPFIGQEQEFIFIRLTILREYLERELQMDGLPFPYEFDRALDDWVFMNFFVGNDFLPHLPSLQIREGAIDRLVKIYKSSIYKTGGYLTDSGVVDLSRVQVIMSELGKVEDEIFKQRRETDLGFKRRDKERKERQKRQRGGDRPKWMAGGQYAPQAVGGAVNTVSNPRQEARDHRMQSGRDSSNLSAANELRQVIQDTGADKGEKRKAEEEEEKDPEDDVKLWEDGWKDRYYKTKFDTEADDLDFRHNVANHYVRGLCWVLRYYYQGCASWKWYFPYHYAPFASDFVNLGDLPNDFELNTAPFQPLEQLMSVFPAASKKHVPPTWRVLMEDPESPIIDFYPTDFKIDLNGKKFAWQGVALLPFVDEKRLKEAVKSVYPDLTDAERKRNIRGESRLFVGGKHSGHSFLEGLYEGGNTNEPVDMNPKLNEGLSGQVWSDEFIVATGATVYSPLPACKDIPNNMVCSSKYNDPVFEEGHLFPARLLPSVTMPARVLKPEDFERMLQSQQRGRGRGRGGGRGFGQRGGGWRPQLGFKPESGYRRPEDKDISVATRMIRHETQSGGYGGGGGGRACYNCGQEGHMSRDCNNQGRSQSRGYGGESSSRWQGASNYNSNRGGQGGGGYGGNSGGYGGGGGGYGGGGGGGYGGGGGGGGYDRSRRGHNEQGHDRYRPYPQQGSYSQNNSRQDNYRPY